MINSLRISLTDICNYGCLFCHNEGLVEGESETLLTDNSIEFIAKAAEEIGVRKFTISGGEPMVNRQFMPILRKLRQVVPDSQINVASNMALSKAGQIEELVTLVDQFNVNFQSASRSNFKLMTRLDKLEATIKNVKHLKSAGAKVVSLNYVYTSANKKELEGILVFANEIGVKVKILEVIRDSQNSFLHVESSMLLDELTALGYRSVGFRGHSDEYFEDGYGNRRVRIIHSYCNKFDEPACRSHGEIRITPDLEIRPCIKRSDADLSILDDIRDGSIAGIVHKLQMSAEPRFKVCP